jgi:hypothetical protein
MRRVAVSLRTGQPLSRRKRSCNWRLFAVLLPGLAQALATLAGLWVQHR